MLAGLSGAPPRRRPVTAAKLARKLASPLGMDDWVRVRLGSVGGDLVATPLPRGAGVLTSLVRADGLLVVPAGVEGHHAGSTVSVELLRGLDEIARTIVAIGSHDLVLDLAASALRADDPWSPWRRPTSARSAGSSRCATGSAISPGRTCSTWPPASTRCRTWTACSARPLRTSRSCDWCTGSRG